jgi:hypothetical protein
MAADRKARPGAYHWRGETGGSSWHILKASPNRLAPSDRLEKNLLNGKMSVHFTTFQPDRPWLETERLQLEWITILMATGSQRKEEI